MPVRGPSMPVRVLVVGEEDSRDRPDRVVTEEPMEIRAHGPGQRPAPVAVTMRTPGNDFELAVGFLLTEGVIADPADLQTVRYCTDDGMEQRYNVVTVALRCLVDLKGRARAFVANASCGICGKESIDQVLVSVGPVHSAVPPVRSSVLLGLPATLRTRQKVFDETGGLHAAAVFSADGALVALREDVGRHNALDKLVGDAALAGRLPLTDDILLVSGRMSFEIVQKAAVAGIGVVCGVSAPSSLAVETARQLNMTLVGFLRGERFNVYSHPERVALGA